MGNKNTLENVLSKIRRVDNGALHPDTGAPLGECWMWTGATNNTDYGSVKWDGVVWSAHVLVYFLTKGIPLSEYRSYDKAGDDLDHLCKWRSCVAPHHLQLKSHKENVRAGNVGKKATACIRGHQFTKGSFEERKVGGRVVRFCVKCREDRG